MIDIYYRADMVKENGGFSPSSYKPAKVIEDWQESYSNEIKIHDFRPLEKEDYIKNFGEKDWLEREQVWGNNSLATRVVERTKNIEQLLLDFDNFIKNDFKPFERKEAGLFETISKKRKM